MVNTQKSTIDSGVDIKKLRNTLDDLCYDFSERDMVKTLDKLNQDEFEPLIYVAQNRINDLSKLADTAKMKIDSESKYMDKMIYKYKSLNSKVEHYSKDQYVDLLKPNELKLLNEFEKKSESISLNEGRYHAYNQWIAQLEMAIEIVKKRYLKDSNAEKKKVTGLSKSSIFS